MSWWSETGYPEFIRIIRAFLGLVPEPDAPEYGEATPEPEPVTITSPQSGSMTFVWKPKSENDGRLVVLFPWKYRYKEDTDPKYTIRHIYIKGGPRDGEEPHKIYHPRDEAGRFRNGNRAHARWKKKGGKYGKDFRVVVELGNGERESWKIKKGEKRTEIRG